MDQQLVLTSRANPLLRHVRSLHRRRSRYDAREFIVEGERAISDALDLGVVPRHVFLHADARQQIARYVESVSDHRPAPAVHIVEPALFAELTDTVTPSGILAVFGFPNVDEPPGTPLVVVADELRDPGNLGSLMRSAVAAGASRLMLTRNTVDPFNPKVVRAGMGAHFRLPLNELDDVQTGALVDTIPTRVLAEAGDHPPPEEVDWTEPSLLIVGSEATGPGIQAQALASRYVSIPLQAGMESLNVATAAAVILFEASRQRRNISKSHHFGDFRQTSY